IRSTRKAWKTSTPPCVPAPNWSNRLHASSNWWRASRSEAAAHKKAEQVLGFFVSLRLLRICLRSQPGLPGASGIWELGTVRLAQLLRIKAPGATFAKGRRHAGGATLQGGQRGRLFSRGICLAHAGQTPSPHATRRAD